MKVAFLGKNRVLHSYALINIRKKFVFLFHTARNSIASCTIFKNKPELSGNLTNELPRKMVKIHIFSYMSVEIRKYGENSI